MLRHIVFYLPSNVVPAVCSLLLVFAYTRVLTPEEFGIYSLVFSGVLVAQNAMFFALPVAITRFHPGAVLNDQEYQFLKTAYALFYAMAMVVVVVGVGIMSAQVLEPSIQRAAWLAVPLLLSRAAVGMNQAVNRSSNRMGRYNAIECAHALLGIGIGLALIPAIGPQAEAVLLGLLISALICAVGDAGLLLFPFRRHTPPLDRAAVIKLARYAWPLIAVAATACVLQLSDRFLLGSFGDTSMLGIYAVAYSLVDRPMGLICSAISTATFPMAVQIMEKHGREAGRIQAGKNGAVLLAITLPACAGLALTAPEVSATLVGAAFRDGVSLLIPIMCMTALLHGVRAHFVDHAFHLSGQSSTMLWSYGPAAVANVVLNVILIPRYGMVGAAWTGLACQALAVVVGWVIGQRVFPLWIPLGEVARIIACVVVMSGALLCIEFADSWLGLGEAIATGGSVFALAALVANPGQVRSHLLRLVKGRVSRNVLRTRSKVTSG